jgi:AcrR family transcriptional regulator
VAAKARGDTRARIIGAAETLAREVGPGRLSLDAVAARAGVSKGGLLYHFPSKTRLLEALVEGFLGEVDGALQDAEADGSPNAVAMAYLAAVARRCACSEAPSSGLLAAFAEDPGLLDPVRAHERDFLARMRANAADPGLATLAFLVAHGIRGLDLLDLAVLGQAEIEAALARLREGFREPA